MVTLIFRAKMQAGKEDEAWERLKKMAEAVRAQEPGALAYLFHRAQEDPSQLVLFEVYADDAALQAHTQTPHMAGLRSVFGELFDLTQMKVERLERVAGFVRPEG